MAMLYPADLVREWPRLSAMLDRAAPKTGQPAHAIWNEWLTERSFCLARTGDRSGYVLFELLPVEDGWELFVRMVIGDGSKPRMVAQYHDALEAFARHFGCTRMAMESARPGWHKRPPPGWHHIEGHRFTKELEHGCA
jgi:hypothetical protein